MIIPGSSAPDPFLVAEIAPGREGYRWTDGRTRVSPALVVGQSTLILIVAGQSNSDGWSPDLYVPVNSNLHHFSLYDGGCYAAREPPLGPNGAAVPLSAPIAGTLGGGQSIRAADGLRGNGKFARVIIASIGVGGTYAQDWGASGRLGNRFAVLKKRFDAAGYPGSATVVMDWTQGEADAADLTTTQAGYLADLQAMVANFRASFPTVPIYLNKSTYPYNTTSWKGPQVRAAMDQAIAADASLKSGCDCDTVASLAAHRQGGAGGLHLTGPGCQVVANDKVARWTAQL